MYIRGLPMDIARSVRGAKPKTFHDAYLQAVSMEVGMENGPLPDTRTKHSPIEELERTSAYENHMSADSKKVEPLHLNTPLISNLDSNIVKFFEDPDSISKNMSLENGIISIPLYGKFRGNPGTTLHDLLQTLKKFSISNGLKE